MVRPPLEDSAITWRKDLETIRACGFNTARAWVDWASGEPAPAEFHFEALDLLMELAEEVGLRVIIQIYLDSAPDWLAKYYPDCRYVSAGGVAIDSQGAPGYCYDHPGVRTAAERFMTTLAKHVTDRPNFFAWDLWSEPHIVQWGYFDFLPQPAVFCYCHHTLQRFRDWLKRKYADLEALNTAWYRKFSSWDLVTAPKFISLMSYTEYIDWIHFIQDKLAEDLSWRQAAIKKGDDHLCTSHSAVPMVLSSPLDEQGSPDDWKMARSVEVWGTSLYPKHVGAKDTQHAFFRSAMLTSTRSACDANQAPYWLGELQAGHGYVGMFASHMTADDARHYLLQPLAHGAKGLCFYAWQPMSSGYESAGFGMANLDGSPSERALAAGELARLVSREMPLFYHAKPTRAQAAVCLNNYANIMWVCMRQPWHYIPSRSYVGAYKALYQEHVEADFIHPDEIVEGKLERYKLLYLPFAFMLPKAAGGQIARFIEGGGVVLAEARTGWNDEHGYCDTALPGFGLDGVFGCREKGTESVERSTPIPIRIVRWHPALPRLSPGDILFGSCFKEALEPLSTQAQVVGIFEDGSPAVVAHPYGKGWAIFVGSLLSLAYYQFDQENSGKLLRGLTELAGIERRVEVGGIEAEVDLETRLLEGTDEAGKPYYLFFAFNHTSLELKPHFEIKVAPGEYHCTNLQLNSPVQVSSPAARLELETILPARDIWLVKIIHKPVN